MKTGSPQVPPADPSSPDQSSPDESGAAKSIADIIAEGLARRIVLGELPPGRKVGQDHVAAEFRASHVPVREAFRRLEARGLLVAEPRRGVRVAPIDPAAVREVTEMRAVLEVLALRRAAQALAAADLAAARRAIADGEASDDLIVWEAANRRFHRALIVPCAMPRLLRAIDDLHQASARFLLATWKDLDWRPRSDAEHRAILERIEAGDIKGAAALLRDHILGAGKALARTLDRAAEPAGKARKSQL
jgi:DNA-binding GntR family transcriptional regulator